MLDTGRPSSMKIRSRSPRRTRRHRPERVLDGAGRGWLLEDRCLLSGGPPYTFPTPYADSMSDVLSNEVQVLSNQTGINYQKTITLTNNSPTQTLYAFLEGEATSQAIAPYQGTSEYDPFDASNQEYRGYVGYTDGTNDYAGLPPLSTITITVPIAFWDSGRIIFSTDGADQFSTYGGSNGGSVPGAPFNYESVNTSATFFCNLDSTNSDQLDFTSIYNGFDSSGMPTTASWKSPVTSGLFTNGETFKVTGGNLPSAGVQVTIDSSHPNDVTLPQGVTTSQTPEAYTFQLTSGESISPTVRYVQPGFTLTTQGSPSTTNGLVMWYHALQSQAPSNEAPFQLTELTFRGTLYAAVPGFQVLMDANDYNGAKTDSLDYDLSFVDSINLPVAMEATNVSIPNTTSSAPFGWVGSGMSIEAFQAAIAAFASTNTAGDSDANDLGTYFSGGQGYPSYVNVESGNLKLPSGQNLFLGSPAVAAPADIKFYMQFPDQSVINEPLYLLTSGGVGPTQLAIGGDPTIPSQGDDLGLHVNDANTYALLNFIGTNLSPSHPYQVTYGNDQFAGNVVGLYYSTSDQLIGVQLDRPVPADASQYVYTFKQSIQDYAASRVAGLWYSWAQYYADNVTSTPMDDLSGTISAGNILTLANAAPGLVPGMTVAGAGVPAGCIILSIAPDETTIELSAVPSGNPTSFSFTSPSFSSIVGFDNPPTVIRRPSTCPSRAPSRHTPWRSRKRSSWS